MKLRTNVGQIFLLHPKDENFSVLFEESFSKHGETIQLFMVMEISPGITGSPTKLYRKEYEKLSQIIVTTLKKTYVTAPKLDEDIFEKALAAINAALSRVIGKGKINWFGRMHVALAALWNNQLAISATGNALVYLVRKNDWTLLSENLTETAARPVKIFSNFSSGKLASGDRVILSTKQLFNYLSLDRLREFFGEQTLAETCQEAIAAVSEVKDTGFATFIFEVAASLSKPSEIADQPTKIISAEDMPTLPAPATSRQKFALTALIFLGRALWGILKFVWFVLARLIGGLNAALNHLFRKKTKRYLFATIALVILIFLGNLAFQTWKKNLRQNRETTQAVFTQISSKLDEAEAALIYNDLSRATSLVQDAEKLFTEINPQTDTEEKQTLQEKLAMLKNKIDKEIWVNDPAILTTFSTTLTELVHSPNGFLGFNRNSLALFFYDFRSGETKSVLENQNLSSLASVDYAGGSAGYVFFHKDGKLKRLDLFEGQILDFPGDQVILTNPNIKIQTLKIFGEGAGARFYLLDTTQKQIWRSRLTESGPAAAEAWLKSPRDTLDRALDIAVDGNIYVLFSDRLEKYFNGALQQFELSVVNPPLRNAAKVFTRAEYTNIYILDPQNNRVIVFDKQGRLVNQIRSEKFRDLTDMFVDEKNNLLQILAGAELLQVSLNLK